MREDMYKVIVERPRRWKGDGAAAARRRNDFEGPERLATRAGYAGRALNENLAPLRRFLRSQVGRPWNKVFSEICAGIDRRNTVQQHIHQHIHDFIAIDVDVRDGQLVDLANTGRYPANRWSLHQELYVDPRSGLIRVNRDHRSWRRSTRERRQREQTEIAARRRCLDARTLLLLLDDVWFRVELDVLPDKTEARYDVVLRRHISKANYDDLQICKHMYGSYEMYALRKQQISTREIKRQGLRKQP